MSQRTRLFFFVMTVLIIVMIAALVWYQSYLVSFDARLYATLTAGK